jgi:DNA-binding NtrC family response regulator
MSQAVQILLVEDDPLLRESFVGLLPSQYQVSTASTGEQASQLLHSKSFDLVILDLHLGQEEGQKLIKPWKQKFPLLEIIILSGQKEIKVAIECMRLGASDYLVKPMEIEEMLITLEKVIEKRRLKQSLERLEPLIQPNPITFIGDSQPVQEVIEKAKLLKNQSHLNVLILGESGTGKEILARFLHQQEGNPKRPFVVANMPAIPVNLMEAELFGVERGAYTDAKFTRPGKFELADLGDIFLDEIGDLPLDMQSKILRVLQERQIQRVGSNRTQALTFRTIAATNQPLADFISQGKFREDLIYRLSDVVLWLPPLRERISDIPQLVDHFIAKHFRGEKMPKATPALLNQLMSYHWPGNTRQLESTIKRALIFCKGANLEQVEIYDPRNLKAEISGNSLQGKVKEFERSLITEMLRKTQGKKTPAMEALGLSKATFYRKLQELGITDFSGHFPS